MMALFSKGEIDAYLARIAAKIRAQLHRIRSSRLTPQPLAQSCAALPAKPPSA